MKTNKLIMAAVAVSLVGAVQAEERKRERPPHRIPPEIIEQFDKDGDGKLNEEELKAAKEAREEKMKAHKEEMLKKFDANGDGELDEKEREEMRKQALEKFDKDGDGKLSEEEKKAMYKELGMRPRPNGHKEGKDKKRAGGEPEEGDEAPGVLGE